jgi:acyl carrier protein
MNGNDQIRERVIQVLQRIAPEADLATLDPQVEFRDQLDIDSYDFLTFVIGLHEALDVDIPEANYQDVATLDGAVGYLARALDGQAVPRR